MANCPLKCWGDCPAFNLNEHKRALTAKLGLHFSDVNQPPIADHTTHHTLVLACTDGPFDGRPQVLKIQWPASLLPWDRRKFNKQMANEIKFLRAFSRPPHHHIMQITVRPIYLNGRYCVIQMDAYQNTLHSLLANPLLFPADDAVVAVRSVAEAVHYLHRRRTAHRDIKPANIMAPSDVATGLSAAAIDHSIRHIMRADPIPLSDALRDLKLADFGLTIEYDCNPRDARSTEYCGTPPYMSPEIARLRTDPGNWYLGCLGRRRRYNPFAADVYALGVLAIMVVVGGEGRLPEALAQAHRALNVRASPISPARGQRAGQQQQQSSVPTPDQLRVLVRYMRQNGWPVRSSSTCASPTPAQVAPHSTESSTISPSPALPPRSQQQPSTLTTSSSQQQQQPSTSMASLSQQPSTSKALPSQQQQPSTSKTLLSPQPSTSVPSPPPTSPTPQRNLTPDQWDAIEQALKSEAEGRLTIDQFVELWNGVGNRGVEEHRV